MHRPSPIIMIMTNLADGYQLYNICTSMNNPSTLKREYIVPAMMRTTPLYMHAHIYFLCKVLAVVMTRFHATWPVFFLETSNR